MIVYKLDPDAYRVGPPVPIPQGFEVRCYERFEAVPKTDLATLHPAELSRITEQAEQELRAGAVMWIGYIDGIFAATEFSIRGRFLKRWFLPLAPNDIVIFGVDTLNAFRGRGIHPAMLRAAVEREADAGVYCDTNVWNVVAQRNMEKAGFRPIMKARALS